jgi:NAD-dependent dihydropyrimidine dehydrogenase PreA subunit
MGVFIQIEIEPRKIPFDQARQLIALCPVDIFALDNGELSTRPEREDECTLCELCLELAAPGCITILKTYNDEVLISHGPEIKSGDTR